MSKRNGIGNFVRATIEPWVAAELPDQVQKALMKLGNGQRAERETRFAPIRRCADNCMVEKIEGDLHALFTVRDYRSCRAPCVDVKGRAPRVVNPRRASEPIFADNLGVQVECRACLAPGFIGNFG